jgi:hypothetical protein
MRPRLLAVLAIAAVLAACAAPTPYRPAVEGRGYGFSEELLEHDRFRVSFRSNDVTPRETAENYALLRAAEIALARGGDWFVVVRREVTYDNGDYDDSRGGVGVGGGSGGVGAGVGIGAPLGMEGPDSRTVGLEIVIRRGAKPAGEPDAYDARAVRRAIAPRG